MHVPSYHEQTGIIKQIHFGSCLIRYQQFTKHTLIKSGLDVQHWPNLPVGKSGLMRGMVETRTATASTNPFSV
jgi:hypothetical protein